MSDAVLAAGHGGKLPGQNGAEAGVLVEDDYVLEVCRYAKHSLWPLENVRLLRERDEKISLAERGRMIGEMNAGLAIEVHVDSRPAGSQSGMFVFYWPGNWRGATLAKEICRHAPQPLQPASAREATDKWPRVQNVLRPHPTNCISLLVEIGDARDEEAHRYMLTKIGKRRIAHAIAAGVLYWMDQEAAL